MAKEPWRIYYILNNIKAQMSDISFSHTFKETNEEDYREYASYAPSLNFIF